MPVTSTTLAGVNVWQLSGAVTDAELKTAWSALIVGNRYKPGRAIYIDSTCSLVNVRGTYYIDSEAFGVILHLSRNKANTLFSNWVLTQTVGLSVGARSNFVRFTNGTTITNSTDDGIDMKGGGFIYAVIGNPGGGDPRFLNEMQFGSLDGTVVTSAAWTEQEVEPTSIGTIWKGLNVQKAAGYPILSKTGGTQRHVIYRSAFNSEGATLRLVRPYYNNSLCYVSSTVRRQGAPVTSNLLDTFGSNGSAVIMVLNNFTDESWFGASKTALTGANWNAGNRVIGGVLKKIQVQPSTLIRTYDSRSTSASQKSTFSETTSDFLSGTDSTTSDASTGRAQIVCVGAIATGGSIGITRYTGQRFTLQKFGFRVQVETPDMTFGDDDLSAFSPITMAAQNGLVRTQAAITAATSIETYRELLEELHTLAIGLVGSASYSAPFAGNLFELSGNTLTTQFASVLIDKTAAEKISYNAATGALVIRSTTLASGTTVSQWSNATGLITVANGATISGVYADSAGQRVRVFGLDPEGFGITWYLRHRVTGTTTWTNLSGTGNQTLVVLTAGVYEFQVRAPGYDWESAEIDTAVSLSLDMALRFQVSASNTPQYEMAYSTDLANIFQYDATAMKVSVANTTAGILSPGFAELYQATQRIQHIPTLVWTWTAPVTANATSQKILIPTGNPISMYLTDASTNTVKITCPVIHADTGISADDRVRGNAGGYSIILGSPATAESAGLASQIISGLGGPNFVAGDHGLALIKAAVDLIKTATDAVKTRTDLIPSEPAAVGSAMTLTGVYDAAKTAASQTSVDAIASNTSAIGTICADLPNLTEIEASDVLAKANAVAAVGTAVSGVPGAVRTELATELGRIDVATSTRSALTAAGVWGATTRTLTQDTGLTTAQADQLSAVATGVTGLGTAVAGVPGAVRTELATELGRIDAKVSTRSTLTAQDIPAGLTAAQVWGAETRTLTDAPGLTDTQAEQLRKVAQLHGVGVALEVTETSRTAGDVSQTITTAEDGSTTVSAA